MELNLRTSQGALLMELASLKQFVIKLVLQVFKRLPTDPAAAIGRNCRLLQLCLCNASRNPKQKGSPRKNRQTEEIPSLSTFANSL